MNKTPDKNSERKVIAVVEGDPAVRNSLVFSLETENFIIRAYARGQDFLDNAAATPIDALIAEYNLGDITGLDLVDELRLRHFGFPAILIATHPNQAVRRKAAYRKIPIVEKPLLGNALIDKLRELLNQP